MARRSALKGNRKRSPLQLQVFAPDCLEQVYLIACQGLSDEEMCKIFGVSGGKLAAWRRQYRDFDEAIARGRLMVDAKAVEGLYKNVVGYDHKKVVRTTQYDEDGFTVGVTVREEDVHVPGSVSAQTFWLKNRQRELWKETKEVQVNVVHTLGSRLQAALERVGRPSLPNPSVIEGEVLPAEPVELPDELAVSVGSVPDPDTTE